MDQTLPLSGRHALVCGASAGIGQASAFALAKMGATLTILARRQQRLEDLVAPLKEAGAPDVYTLVADFDKRDDLVTKVSNHLEQHGPIQIWINNTGGPPGGLLLEAEEEELLTAFGRHLFSAQRLLKLLLPGMKDAGYGRIISVLSTSVREPIPQLGVSNTVRAAMASWSKTLSGELPPGITINSILPGFTATERLASLAEARAEKANTTPEDIERGWLLSIPEGRLGSADELGNVIAFLASPMASYVRGVCLPVDGGRLRSI